MKRPIFRKHLRLSQCNFLWDLPNNGDADLSPWRTFKPFSVVKSQFGNFTQYWFFIFLFSKRYIYWSSRNPFKSTPFLFAILCLIWLPDNRAMHWKLSMLSGHEFNWVKKLKTPIFQLFKIEIFTKRRRMSNYVYGIVNLFSTTPVECKALKVA